MRVGELVDEARLAHPRLADDRRHLTVTVAGELLGAAELLQLGVAADEPRQPAPGGRLQAGPRRARPRHLVDLHGVGEPLHRHGAERLHLDVALGQRQRLGRDHDRAGIGELLHPRGQVRRLADGRVVHVEIAADGAHDDLPGVQPDADLDHGRVRASHLVRVLLHALLHPERRVAGPHRVVLVGERRAEERHDPVAHHLVDRALVAVDRLHHALEHGVEELARLLGIAVGEQLHRALQVGEEDRDLLALALQRRLGDQDLFREVLGGVCIRRREPGLRSAGPRSVLGAPTGCAHSRQNLADAGSGVSQFTHCRASGVAHSRQNLACGGFSCRHRGHVTCALPSGKAASILDQGRQRGMIRSYRTGSHGRRAVVARSHGKEVRNGTQSSGGHHLDPTSVGRGL